MHKLSGVQNSGRIDEAPTSALELTSNENKAAVVLAQPFLASITCWSVDNRDARLKIEDEAPDNDSP
jgi:uncharacterized membrane protein